MQQENLGMCLCNIDWITELVDYPTVLYVNFCVIIDFAQMLRV